MRDQPFTAAEVEALADELDRNGKEFYRADFDEQAKARDMLRAFADSLRLADQGAGWQPISTAPKDKTILLRVPLDNGLNPKMATVIGFFADAGSIEMDDWDSDDVHPEDGTNLNAAWFSRSDDREPYAMMLNWAPTLWQPLPQPPSTETSQ